MNTIKVVGAALAAGWMIGAARSADVPKLFADGKTEWKIEVAADAAEPVKFAAKEFAAAFEKASGAKIGTLKPGETCAHKVRIFASGDTWDDEVVEYFLRDGDLCLTGNQPRAALHAVYAFLQRELDVRWLWPGDDGEFIARRDAWSFPAKFGFRHTPSIRYRGFHHCGDWRDREAFYLWQTRNFATAHRHGVGPHDRKYGHYSIVSSHNVDLSGDLQFSHDHPEAYALRGGKRRWSNLCYCCDLGAYKVAEKLEESSGKRLDNGTLDILSIFPADNQDYCQCEKCKELGVSTSWFKFYNLIVGELRKKHPKAHFATIAYQGYHPSPAVKVENTDFVEYASHDRDYNRLLGDPKARGNQNELKNIRAWQAEHPEVKHGLYTYSYDVNWYFIPFFSMIADDIDYAATNKYVTYIPGVNLHPAGVPLNETSYARNRPTLALHCFKTWDGSVTVDTFLDDWCRHAYGPAAAELKEYFTLMDKALLAMDRQLTIFGDVNNMCASMLRDAKLRARIEELFAAAEKKAAADKRAAANVEWERTLYRQLATVRGRFLGEIDDPNAKRKVIYFTGENGWGVGKARGINGLRVDAAKQGWKVIAATNETQLAEKAGEATEYVMIHSTAKRLSDEAKAVIRKNVESGGTLLMEEAFKELPLGDILGDDRFKVKRYVSKLKNDDRKTVSKRGGDAWTVPNNIQQAFWYPAPGVAYVPEAPAEGWIAYASMPDNEDPQKDIPYLSAYRYGKGVIIIVPAFFGCGRFKLIENIRNDLGLPCPQEGK